MERIGDKEFLDRLLGTERPGAGEVLAFYDSTVDAICTNGNYLLIPLADHLCLRSDALFESMRVSDGCIFELEGHLDRLRMGSESFMQLAPPCSWERLRDIVVDVVRAGGERFCNLRIYLGRGAGGFGVSPSECPVPSLYVVALRQGPVPSSVYEKGMTAFASKVPPKQAYLATVKNTNYLPNVLMAREAEECGMDCAVTFHEDGTMGEAAVANIGIVTADGALLFPPVARILEGTSMLCALKVAAQRMPVRRADITRADIDTACEMLLFGSSKLCVGITRFENKVFGDGRPGPVARWLCKAMREEMLATGTRVWPESSAVSE